MEKVHLCIFCALFRDSLGFPGSGRVASGNGEPLR